MAIVIFADKWGNTYNTVLKHQRNLTSKKNIDKSIHSFYKMKWLKRNLFELSIEWIYNESQLAHWISNFKRFCQKAITRKEPTNSCYFRNCVMMSIVTRYYFIVKAYENSKRPRFKIVGLIIVRPVLIQETRLPLFLMIFILKFIKNHWSNISLKFTETKYEIKNSISIYWIL